MIRIGSTGDNYFHRMIIGRVVDVRDTGEAGGERIAVVAVGAHPTGFVPLVARVRMEESTSVLDPEPEFRIGERWVIIARHRRDGSYQHDGYCGQTSRIGAYRFRQLLALTKQHD
jgi:hypothetical protein